MTQISGLPQNIATLQNDGIYVSGGRNGTFELAGTGFAGKAIRFLAQAFAKDTVKAQNQGVLESVAREIRAEYGRDIDLSTIKLPKEVASGEKYITGAEIKVLAEKMIDQVKSSGARREVMGPMVQALKIAIKSGSAAPATLLSGLKAVIPPGTTPQLAKMMIGEAVGALSFHDLRQMREVMIGLAMADLKGLIADTEKMWEAGLKSTDASPGKEQRKAVMEARRDELTALRDLIGTCHEAVNVAAAKGDFDSRPLSYAIPNVIPESDLLKGRYGLMNAPAYLKNSLGELGVADPTQVLKEIVTVSVNSKGLDGILRGNTPGEMMVKKQMADRTAGSGKVLAETLMAALTLPPDGRLSKEEIHAFLTDKNSAVYKALETALTTDPLRSILNDCAQFLNDAAKDAIYARDPDNYKNVLANAFCGTAGIALTAQMNKLNSNSDQENRLLVESSKVVMRVFADKSPVLHFFEQLPGWHQLMMPPAGATPPAPAPAAAPADAAAAPAEAAPAAPVLAPPATEEADAKPAVPAN